MIILCALAARRKRMLEEKYSRQTDGYRLTPRAAEYRLLWSKQVLSMIDARCKEIVKEAGVDIIDDQVMKKAILETAHHEWVELSNRK